MQAETALAPAPVARPPGRSWWQALLRGHAPGPRVVRSSPVAPNQERYILLETMSSGIFTVGAAWQIEGPLETSRLEAALAELVGRHEALRCRYRTTRDGRWWCDVLDSVERPLESVRLPGAGLAQVREIARRWMFAKPRLDDASTLVRFALVESDPARHWLVAVVHHSLFDGVSLNLMGEDLFALYAGTAPTLPAPGVADVVPVDWREAPAHASALDWWRGHLAGLEDMPALVGDLAVPDEPGAPNGLVELPIPAADLAAVKAYAETLGASAFNVYHAATQVVLSRMSGAPRVPTAFQSNGRRAWPGSDRTLGAFSNALPVAPEVREAQAFADLVKTMRLEMKGALAHERVPMHEVNRLTSINPAVGINWYPPSSPPAAGALRVSAPEQMERRFDYDYNFRFMQMPGGVTLALYTNQQRISPAFARAVAARVLDLAVRHARTPGLAIADVPSHGDPLPAGPAPAPAIDGPLHRPFLARAAATPQAPALRYPGGRLSYGALAERSGRLARQLAAQGVGPGALVGLLATRGPGLVEAMLGTLQAGGTFVTLDLAYPHARLATYLETARPTHLLWAAAGTPDDTLKALADSASLRILQLDPGVHLAPLPEAPVPERIDPGAAAYLLFTSGTTGVPKCLAVSHRPLQRFARFQAETYGLTHEDRFTMVSGLAHDPLMRDIFTPLMLGAEILIPTQETIYTPGALTAWCRAEAPTVMHLTPPLGRLMAAGSAIGEDDPAPLPLRLAFWGGDQLTPDVAAKFAALAPDAWQVNFYGTTETPQAAAAHRVDADIPWRAVPIGTATAGHAIRLDRADGTPCRAGEVGDLAVVSDELAIGQIVSGRLERAGAPGPDGLMTYRTGDRGLLLPGGGVQLVGRADDQVKVRGYRIELADVRRGLTALPQVADALVLPAGPEGDRYLVAFVVPKGAVAETDPNSLLSALAEQLPAHMLPRQIRLLESIPLLPNGKPDRRALIDLAREAPPAPAGDRRPLTSPDELAIASAWSEILGRPIASADDSFATLGGDSLSFVQAFVVLEERFGEVPKGWQFMAIHELARAEVKSRGWLRVVDTPVIIRAIAIVMVLFLHFGVYDYGGGATAAMFMVTGFLLGGMQFAELHATGSGQPFYRLLLKLLPPVFLFGILMYGIKILGGRSPDLSIIFMTTDLVDYSTIGPDERPDYQLALWYVHAMLHILFLFGLLLPLAMQVKALRESPFRFALALFAVGFVLKFALPGLVDPRFFTQDLPRGHWLTYVPTSHIATLALGALLATAKRPAQRRLALAALLMYVGLSYLLIPRNSWQFLLAGGLLLLLVPHIKLPRPAVPPLLAISSASLFIYLLHQLIRPFRWKFNLDPNPWVEVAAGLALGLAAWWIWTKLLTWAQKRFHLTRSNELSTV